MVEPLLDMNVVSMLLGCSPATVVRYCQAGELPFVTVNKGRRKTTRKFKPSVISAFVASRSSVLQSSVNGNAVEFLPPPFSSDFQPAGDPSPEQISAPPPPVQEALRGAEASKIEPVTEPTTEPQDDAATVEPEATTDTERLNAADIESALA